MSKQAIRKQYIGLRKSLTADQLATGSQAICKVAIALIHKEEARNAHIFLPIAKNQEVNTWPIYEFLLNSEKHSPVVSKTHWEEKKLTHHPMTLGDELEESPFGIPEPTHNRSFDIGKIDLILVPLLAFDLRGHRLGYGAGFYDRFLSQCPEKALKVGLSLLPPLESPLPSHEHDVALDLCITPEKVYDFRTLVS